jgi:hypothetical protein
MDWRKPAEPEKVLACATLGYTEGYISRQDFEKIINETTEDSGDALMCAYINRFANIDDYLLMKLINLAGIRLRNYPIVKNMYNNLVKLGKHEHAKKIQMYADLH